MTDYKAVRNSATHYVSMNESENVEETNLITHLNILKMLTKEKWLKLKIPMGQSQPARLVKEKDQSSCEMNKEYQCNFWYTNLLLLLGMVEYVR